MAEALNTLGFRHKGKGMCGCVCGELVYMCVCVYGVCILGGCMWSVYVGRYVYGMCTVWYMWNRRVYMCCMCVVRYMWRGAGVYVLYVGRVHVYVECVFVTICQGDLVYMR